ncbi:MAG TPA: response regulator [Bacteroidia bacterium]|jgi:two-component system response regulator LytT|nr:response regulator [Bacteroidia bacterium]
MSKIKVAIVEDEVIIARNITDNLIALGYEVVGPAVNYTTALELIEKEKPDLLLLDIQLSGRKDGIELAQAVKKAMPLPFIFLTANSDSATIERAKRTEPNAYLVKPFTKEDLFTAIEICLYNYSRKAKVEESAHNASRENYIINDAIFIRESTVFVKVPFRDILYLESDHVYVNVYTENNKYLVRTSLQQYMKNFDPNKFYQVHRSYVVNIENVNGINETYVLVNNKQVPIAKPFRDDLLSRLKWV